jgi:hypothetical protein
MINTTIKINTRKSVIFQKELAFFSSINCNATNPNLTADNPIIKLTASVETSIEVDTKAVVMVKNISTPYVYNKDFFIF